MTRQFSLAAASLGVPSYVVDVKYRQTRGYSLGIEPPPVLEMSMEAEGGETALEF